MDFEFNDREIKKMLDGVIADERKDLQKLFDRLGREYEGQPVATVRTVLQREFRKRGGTVTDPELSEWATAISEGTRIVVK
jgi:hypothetical protein